MFKGGTSGHFFNQYTRELTISGWFLPSKGAYDTIKIFDSTNAQIGTCKKSTYRYDAVKALNLEASHALCGWSTKCIVPKKANNSLIIELHKDDKRVHSIPFRITIFDKVKQIMKVEDLQISTEHFSGRNDFERSSCYAHEKILKEIEKCNIQLIKKQFDFKDIVDSYFSSQIIEKNKDDSTMYIGYLGKHIAPENISVAQVDFSSNKVPSEAELIQELNKAKSNPLDLIHIKTVSPSFLLSDFEYFITLCSHALVPGGRAIFQDFPINVESIFLIIPDKLEEICNIYSSIKITSKTKVFTKSSVDHQVVLEYLSPDVIKSVIERKPTLNFEIIYHSNAQDIPHAPIFSLIVQKGAE